jgi:hypothetical protein
MKGIRMTQLPSYNGWPNYPTWNVALWMDNDEGGYGHARDLTRTAIEENTSTEWAEDEDGEDTHELDRDGAVADLGEALKEWHDDATPDLEGFTADIFGWAMGFVEWRHIAENLVAEAAGDE